MVGLGWGLDAHDGWLRTPRLILTHTTTITTTWQGASGQAVQNFNVMLGYPETTGLMSPPMFP